MKLDTLEFFEQCLLSLAYCLADLVLFLVLLNFTDVENAYLFAGMGLGFIFYDIAIKIGMIKYD